MALESKCKYVRRPNELVPGPRFIVVRGDYLSEPWYGSLYYFRIEKTTAFLVVPALGS